MPTLISKTIKSSGGDYTTLVAWAAANIPPGTNLVTADQIQQAVVFDQAVLNVSSVPVAISNVTTDSGHYIEITADSSTRHVGVYDETKSSFITNNVGTTSCITVTSSVNDFKLSWMQFTIKNLTGANATTRVCVSSAAKNTLIENCIFKQDSTNPAGTVSAGCQLTSNVAGQLSAIRNCILFGFTANAGSFGLSLNTTLSGMYAYNCTVYNCRFGISITANSTVKNCLAVNCPSGPYSGTGTGSSNNISDVASPPGTNSKAFRTVTFVNTAANDFRLTSTDIGATGYGIDLSADTNFPFSADITGATRSGIWSAGASNNFQAVAYASPNVVVSEIRSTGTSTGYPLVSGRKVFDNLVNWNATQLPNTKSLVSDDEIQQALIFDPLTITAGLIMSNSVTTSATRYIEITADPSTRHVGIYDEAKSVIIGNTVSNLITIIGTASLLTDIRISWLQFINKNVSIAIGKAGINATCMRLRVENCIFKCDTAVTSTATVTGITFASSITGQSEIIRNCVAFGFVNTGAISPGFNLANVTLGSASLYNCTSYGCDRGFVGASSTCVVKNCLAVNCTNSFIGFTGAAASTNNVSSGSISIPSASNLLSNRVVTFVNAAAGDFRLASADFGVTAYGKNLSADASFPFSTDITGATITGAWSCGASCNPFALTNGVAVITSQIRSTGNSTGTGGSPAAFDTLVNWYAAMLPSGIDLTAAGFNQIQRAVVFTPTLNTKLTIANCTTDATHYIEITADPTTRHVGIYDESKSAYIVNNGTDTSCISSNVAVLDIRISWMQFIIKNLAAGNRQCLDVNARRMIIENCIFKHDPAVVAALASKGLGPTSSITTPAFIVRNCISIGFNTDANSAGIALGSAAVAGGYVYNCTSYNCNRGFWGGGTSSTIFSNCLAHTCTTPFVVINTTGSFSNASDATALGVQPRSTRTVTFVNAGAGDLRLASGDTGVTGLGAELNNDQNFPFNTDITGATITGPWSIGASFNLKTGSVTTVTKTIKSSGGDYTTINAWWAANGSGINLQSTNEIRKAIVFTIATQASVSILSGSLGTDSTRYFEITADSSTRHVGIYNAAKSLIDAGTQVAALDIRDVRDIKISWLQFTGSAPGSTSRDAIVTQFATHRNVTIENCLFTDAASAGGAGAHRAISLTSSAPYGYGASTIVVRNCVAFGMLAGNSTSPAFYSGGLISTSATKAYFYNCTAYGGNAGFSGLTAIYKNCLAANNTTQGLNTGSSLSSNNAVTDGSSVIGSNIYQNVTPSFVDAANGDVHLQTGDLGVTGLGIDLSADPIAPFSTDFDGTAITGTWSIGADWNLFTPPTTKSFYYALSQGMR